VPREPAAVREPVLEEPGQQILVVGQRHDAVADVARRQHSELTTQAPRRAAVVAHRHHRSEIGDLAADVALEPTQQHGEARPAADRHQIRRHDPGPLADLARTRRSRPADPRRALR
jgi:hypothetical protein